MTRKILAGSFSFPLVFSNHDSRYQAGLNNGLKKANDILDALILYDEITILTYDYMEIQFLLRIFGEKYLEEIIDREMMKFIRIQGAIGYAGGLGLVPYSITDKNGEKNSSYKSTENVISLIQTARKEPVQDSLLEAISRETTTIEMKTIASNIIKETYEDVKQSERIQKYYKISGANVASLTDLQENQFRIMSLSDSPEWSGTRTDMVLEIATANTELCVADIADCQDVSTCTTFDEIYYGKLERLGLEERLKPMSKLLDYTGIPSLATAYTDERSNESENFTKRLIRLRESVDGISFRRWFHETSSTTGDIVKEYCALVTKLPSVQIATRDIGSFLFCLAIATIDPTMGIVASGYSILLNRMNRTDSPKFFLSKLDKLSAT